MTTGGSPSILDVALEYGALGFRVVPVLPNKQPAIGNDWGNKASCDAGIIRSWWEQWPNANVGICPDEDFCVLDVDVKNNGYETLANFEALHGALPRTVSGTTGGGGKHFYFRCDPKRELHRVPAGKSTGIEILKKGHQGIEFPSIHANGNQYTWDEYRDIRLLEKDFWALAPEWFYKPRQSEQTKPEARHESVFGQKKPYYNGSTTRFEAYCNAALAGERQRLANCGDGDRNNSLNVAALKLGHLDHYGFFDKSKAKQELRISCELNGLIKDTGLKAFEATFESGWSKGITEPKFIEDREEYKPDPEPRTEYGPEINPETGEYEEPTTHFKLVPFLEAKPILTSRYLVKGLVPSEGLVIIWGPPKCGKSFWVSDICAHIAAGIEYRGKRVRRGNVVYVAAEGASGFMGRLEAWRLAHPEINHADMTFYTVPQRLNLREEYALLINDIRAKVGDLNLDVVTLDTLNRTFSGSESSDEDMTAYVMAADAIKNEFNCAVIIIHHCGIDGTRPRGHSSLTGACDAQIAISRDDQGIITSKLEWMKDGDEGFETHSKLDVVELGADEDGDQVTTCVVVESEQLGQASKPKKTMSNGTNIVFTALKMAIQEAGKSHGQGHIPASALIVPMELWRKYSYARSTESGDDAKQKAFRRGAQYLMDNGMIGVWENQCFITE